MSWLDVLKNDPAGTALVENQTYSVNFIVSPSYWHHADIQPPLSWKSVRFLDTEKKKIPPSPGLYAFVVRLPQAGVPSHGWVMYIGQSGDGKSKGTLRVRYEKYLANRKSVMGRAKVYFMLNNWDSHLEFFYTELPNRKNELVALETRLLDAFRPPFTDRTYSGTYLSPSHAF